jgi:hypothetical protein
MHLEFMVRADLASVAGAIMQLYLLTKLFRTATGQRGRNNTYRSNEASTITILRTPLACQYSGTTTCLSSLLVFLLWESIILCKTFRNSVHNNVF